MNAEDRPDLNKKRSEPRPAAVAGRDPVDTPAPQPVVHRPEAKVLRQFRLSAAEDDRLMQLKQARGDQHLIDTLRWLLSLTPGLLSGEYGIDPTQEPKR